MAGIYIHIPFCKQACHYCDFHFSTSLKNKDGFLNALKKETSLQKDYLKKDIINTVYFGGGTPSLLSQKEILDIFNELNKNYTIDADAEITLEANPDDLTKEKLRELKNTPVNRLSIGVQSFFDEDLKFMNRAHNSEDAYRSVISAKERGFHNISIDLIYGTPTLSNKHWVKNLEKTFSLDVPHISCYCLTVEPRTALADFIKKGKAENINEERSAKQFEILMEMIKNNDYNQYEISNFCKNENYSRHNSNYWLKEKYVGLGPSAHSFNGTSRQWNIANNLKYIQDISKGFIPFAKEDLTLHQQFNEYVLTSLRTMWGCDASKIKNEFGNIIFNTFIAEAKKYIEQGLIIENKNILTLNEKGKLLADKITSDLFQLHENHHTTSV